MVVFEVCRKDLGGYYCHCGLYRNLDSAVKEAQSWIADLVECFPSLKYMKTPDDELLENCVISWVGSDGRSSMSVFQREVIED